MSIFGGKKKSSSSELGPTFPASPMEVYEAVTIVDECIRLMGPGGFAGDVIPDSKMPGGGFLAVVEALAQYFVYVSEKPGQDRTELLEWCKMGVVQFAQSGPDWATELQNKWREEVRTGKPRAMTSHERFAADLLGLLEDKQMTWGSDELLRRIAEITGQK